MPLRIAKDAQVINMILDCSSFTVDQVIETLCQRVTLLLEKQAARPRQRLLIALAGIPGSGKSTISSGLMRKLSESEANVITVVPMVSDDALS